jgi:hypothetical protein
MAIEFTDNKETWESQVASNFAVISSDYGPTSTDLVNEQSTVPTITYPSGEVLVAGDTWATWSGGYTGDVVYFPGSTQVTFSLKGAVAFGFEVEPDQFETESLTVTLSNGQSQTITDDVNGQSGAQFFGFVGTGITSVTITDNSGDSFAIGDFDIQESLGIDYRATSASDPLVSAAPSVAKQFNFVGEYLGGNSSYLTAAKATALAASGLQIVSLYENASMATTAYYETNPTTRGVSVGTAAYADAIKDGQPAGSAVYFAVDTDIPLNSATLLTDIKMFFMGIEEGFQNEANALTGGSATQPSPVLLKIGVYGAGITDSTIKGAGLAAYSWLAESTGWNGSSTYTGWDIKQVLDPSHTMAASLLPSVNFSGTSYDALDLTHGTAFGQWT